MTDSKLEATVSPRGMPELISHRGVASLHLTAAMADYDHVHDLASGAVQPEGLILTPFLLPVEEIFYRFAKHLEWDVSEFSFGKYIGMKSRGIAGMTAIPVFPSRVFRHSGIYVHADSAYNQPQDLIGKRIGIPEWAQTAGIYVRGLLQESYGLNITSVQWIQAGVNEAGRHEKIDLMLPDGVSLQSRGDSTLNDMLLGGEIDAIISARPPRAITNRDGRMRRLFSDARAEEKLYWEKTGIFPIMHVVTIRNEVVDRYPWVATSLFKAFDEARRRAMERLLDFTASRIPLPWGSTFASELQETFGVDFWPYGIEPNRKTLAAFCRFAKDQGVASRLLEPEELFAEQVRGSVRV